MKHSDLINLEGEGADPAPDAGASIWDDESLTKRMGIWSLSFLFCVILLYLWYRCFHRERLMKDKERDERLESLRLKVGGTRIEGDDDASEGGAGGHRRSGKVTRRACAHPAFRNATHDTVDRELKRLKRAVDAHVVVGG